MSHPPGLKFMNHHVIPPTVFGFENRIKRFILIQKRNTKENQKRIKKTLQVRNIYICKSMYVLLICLTPIILLVIAIL